MFKGKYIVLPEGSWGLMMLNQLWPQPKGLSYKRIQHAFQKGKYNNLLIFPNNRMYRKAVKSWLKSERLTLNQCK